MRQQLTFVVLFAALSTWAQNPATSTPPIPTAPAPAAEKDAAQDYSKQPAVVEQLITRYRWEADGTGVRQTIVRAKLQSPLGVQEFGQLPIGYSSENESVRFNYVRVHKADGHIIEVPTKDVQELTAPVAQQAPMYSDFKVKNLVIPSLEVGDTLEYDTTVEITKPLASHEFWMEHDFQKKSIVLDEQLELNVPASVKVTLRTNTGYEPKTETAKDRRVYSWKSKNLTIDDDNDDDDTPRNAKRRKSQQQDADRHPDVQLTTFQSWQELGTWFSALVKDRVEPNAQLQARAKKLVEGKTTDEEKVEVIYDFVSKQFRYVSLSFGVGRFQPHYANDVFANQYGDCKDKHTLFAAMLESVGIHADPVLIHSWRKLDATVPSPAQFDHVISSVNLGNKSMLLDVTPEVAPFGLLSPTLRHKQAVLVLAKGTKVIETPAAIPFEPKESITLDGKVNDLGKLEGNVRIEARGDSELYLRSAFRQVPESRWTAVAKLFQGSLGINGEASDVKVSNLTDTSKPFTVEWQTSAVNFLDWTNKELELRLPIAAAQLPGFEEATDSDDPKPLQIIGAPLNAVYRATLEIPAKYAVTLPVSIDLTRDYGEYHTKYSRDEKTGKVTVERRFRMTQYEVPYERRPDYLAFERGIKSDEQQRVHLESSASSAAEIPSGMKAKDLNEAAMNAFQHDNPREAARLFEKVVELEPKHKEAWNNLGNSYLRLHELSKAETAFRKQIEINAYDEYAYNNLGLALQEEEKWDDAIAAFKKQIEINPLDKYAHANLGNLLLRRKRFAEAASEFETAVSINPKAPYLQAQLGTAYLNLDKTDKAATAFDKAIELAPSPLIWNQIAYELSEKGAQLDRARSYAESAVSTAVANLRNVDLSHLQLSDLANTASVSAFWDTLGWVYFKQGDTQNALKYVSAAWSLAQHAEIADHLAQLHEKLGHATEAKHFYALAAVSYAPTPDVHDHAVKALGSDKELTAFLPRAKAELEQERTYRLSGNGKAMGHADFFVLFGNDGKPVEAKYVSGDNGLKSFDSVLKQAAINTIVPDGSQAKLVRRGTLSCSPEHKDCTFVLLPLEQTTTLE
jgi:tetratricopeptide (TPR) repeat protein